MVDLVFFFLLLLSAGLLWNEGCWSNGITLINVIIAGLVAFNFFEPLAGYMDSQMSAGEYTYSYLCDFLALWGVFALTLGLLRLATDSLSKLKVRFIPPVEQTGRVILGLWAGWVFVCFTAATLHTAPLPVNSFRESFDRKPDEGLFFGFAPDRLWLSLVQTRSQGALGWWDEQPASTEYGTEDKDGNTRVFDPRGEFIVRYRTRRKNLEKHVNDDANGSILPKK
jgi:hypothetical protein